MQETDKILDRYQRRAAKELTRKEKLFHDFMVREREEIYKRILQQHFSDLSTIRVLEIGAGTGGNIVFFKNVGIRAENIYANELIPARIASLREQHPGIQILEGDASMIDSNHKFDIVFQSTVFTSILDIEFRKKLARKMMELTHENGIILWYDFKFNNPANPDVKKVTKREIKGPVSKS